jgi:hypothetical protein
VNKTKGEGNPRKFKEYIKRELVLYYPDMIYLFEDAESGLDIYVPQLHLGFFYYKDYFSSFDPRVKFCLENNISFAAVSVSSIKYFKVEKVRKIFDRMIEIIDENIVVWSKQPRSKYELENPA